MAIVDGKIKCYRCRLDLPVEMFQPSDQKRGCGGCRKCKQELKKEYEKRNRKKSNEAARKRRAKRANEVRARSRAYYHANKRLYKSSVLKQLYGMTIEEYEARFQSQGGKCACCGIDSVETKKSLYVDHCHETGKIRGLICMKCNSGIAALGDKYQGVLKALKYLENAEAN